MRDVHFDAVTRMSTPMPMLMQGTTTNVDTSHQKPARCAPNLASDAESNRRRLASPMDAQSSNVEKIFLRDPAAALDVMLRLTD